MFNISNNFIAQETRLKKSNWYEDTRYKLEELISENSFQNKNVVFDFDNTILCGDIGEAVFKLLVADKIIEINSNIMAISPTFANNNRIVNLTEVGFEEYYNQLLDVFIDDEPYSTAYSWVVQIMDGISIDLILEYTDKAMMKKSSLGNQLFFYPEMIDLIGVLLKNGFNFHIVSASNIWSVRYLVDKYLNPLLIKEHGDLVTIDLSKVQGMNTIIKNNINGKLFKDSVLISFNNYLNFKKNEIKNYFLTSLINYPATSYNGKVASIIKNISKDKVFMVAGDSPNDFAMQEFSENVLWIARLDKSEYQEKAIDEIKKNDNNWIIQPTLTGGLSGFIKSFGDIQTKKPHYLKSAGLYKNYFTN